LRQSPCSSASGRTDSGLAVPRIVSGFKETLGLQADSRSSELKSFCRSAEGRVFRLLRRLAAVPANSTFLRTDACRRAASDSAPRGRVRFQSGYREADPGPHSEPGEPWLPRRELSADGVRGSGAVPVTGGLGPW
jgi:hypothetical protein